MRIKSTDPLQIAKKKIDSFTVEGTRKGNMLLPASGVWSWVVMICLNVFPETVSRGEGGSVVHSVLLNLFCCVVVRSAKCHVLFTYTLPSHNLFWNHSTVRPSKGFCRQATWLQNNATIEILRSDDGRVWLRRSRPKETGTTNSFCRRRTWNIHI